MSEYNVVLETSNGKLHFNKFVYGDFDLNSNEGKDFYQKHREEYTHAVWHTEGFAGDDGTRNMPMVILTDTPFNNLNLLGFGVDSSMKHVYKSEQQATKIVNFIGQNKYDKKLFVIEESPVLKTIPDSITSVYTERD